MAAALGGSHGGKRDNSGRKRKHEGPNSSQKTWNSQHKRVYLSLTIFESWKDAITGYGSCSESDFAAHLLSLGYCNFYPHHPVEEPLFLGPLPRNFREDLTPSPGISDKI